MDTVLLTGFAGFIGSQILRDLLAKGYFVIGLDNMSEGSDKDNFKELKKNDSFVPLLIDINDPRLGNMIAQFTPEPVDFVINCAADSVAEEMILPVYKFGKIDHVTFKELFNQFSKKNKVECQDPSIKLEVINLPNNENTKALGFWSGMGTFSPIKQISRHWYEGKLVRLKQKMGEVLVTPNHSVFNSMGEISTPTENPELLAVRKVNWHQQKSLNFIQLKLKNSSKDISVEKGWMFFKHSPNIKIKKNLKEEDLRAFIRIAGAFISEGNCSFNKANGSYVICISNTDLNWLEELKKDLQSISTCSWDIALNDVCYQLQGSAKIVYEIFSEYFGKTSFVKKMPQFIFNLSNEDKQLFLNYLCFGDGSLNKLTYKTLNRYCSSSYKLQCQLGLLLTLMGKDYNICYKDLPNNVNYSLREVTHYQINQNKKNIEYVDYTGWVYDISVEKVNNFAIGVGNIVVHNTHVDRSWDQVLKYLDSNIKGPLNLANWALKNDVKKFIQVSTDEVFSHSEQPFTEDSEYTPQNIYSSSKTSAEMFLKNYEKALGLPLVITNGANTYGVRQMNEKLIPKTVYNLVKGEKMTLFETPAQRLWLTVENHSAGIIAALENGFVGESYCLAPEPENELYTHDLIKMICEIMDKDFDKWVERVPDRVNYDLRYLMDNQKAKKELGWCPSHNIKEELPRVIDWYVKKYKK